jgi:hypothetical protein
MRSSANILALMILLRILVIVFYLQFDVVLAISRVVRGDHSSWMVGPTMDMTLKKESGTPCHKSGGKELHYVTARVGYATSHRDRVPPQFRG